MSFYLVDIEIKATIQADSVSADYVYQPNITQC